MKNLVFFCDSCADLTYELIEKNKLEVIIMPVYLDGEEYTIDYKNKGDFADLIESLKAKKKPTTAAISTQNYIDIFEPHLKAGKDCIYVSFSHGLTDSFLYMAKAVEELEEKYKGRKIHLADTKSVCGGTGLLVLQAVAMWQSGATAEQIVKFVEGASNHTTMMFYVDDLGHLKRGGRISATTAAVGGMLNVKPILQCEGKLEKCGKANGTKKAIRFLFDKFVENFEPAKDAPVFIVDANVKQNADTLYNLVIDFVKDRSEVLKVPIGPTVMAHCGLGTVGIAYNRKK